MAQGAPAMGYLEPGLGHLEPKYSNATNFLKNILSCNKNDVALITNRPYVNDNALIISGKL